MNERVVPKEAQELAKAKDLISKKKNWCKHRFRKTVPAPWYSSGPDRFQYCALGALEHAKGSHVSRDILQRAAYDLYGMDVIYVNDSQGHKAVMKCYDRAICKVIEEANK